MMGSSKLAWYLGRLSVMPLPEIPWRIARQLRSYRDSLGARTGPAPDPSADPGTGFLLPGDLASRADLVATVEDWLARGVPFFDARWPLTGEPNWTQCPVTGTVSPNTFGMRIDYRDETLVGDIKHLWEPARFQFAVPIAQAWRVTRDERYLEVLRDQIVSFLKQNPHPIGVHWSSPLESALRLIGWAMIWELTGGEASPLFGGDSGARFRRDWLSAIYWHQDFVHRHYAAYSSANNHLIGEACGVFIASSLWPCWESSALWRAKAESLLERECLAQNHVDGVNAEQAFWYQQFVLDFLVLAWIQAQRHGMPLSSAYRERLESMLIFVAAVIDSGGNMPQVGDADDGLATGLWGAQQGGNFASLLATGATLFDRSSLARKSPAFDPKTEALLGSAAREHWARIRMQKGDVLPRRFPDGGYFLLGSGWDSAMEVRCLVDSGPLGMGALAAHGHADALALCLHIAGRPVLIDPGTFAYHTNRRWRDYFRGTSAHNTLRLGGVDQSKIGGNFFWFRKARAQGTASGEVGDVQRFSGSHGGYMRELGATHRREVEYDPQAQQFHVRDTVETGGLVTVEQFWHCHPECDVRLSGSEARIVAGQSRISMSLDSRLDWQLLRGNEERPAGWFSPRFDIKVPTATMVGTGETRSTTAYETHISVELQSDGGSGR